MDGKVSLSISGYELADFNEELSFYKLDDAFYNKPKVTKKVEKEAKEDTANEVKIINFRVEQPGGFGDTTIEFIRNKDMMHGLCATNYIEFEFEEESTCEVIEVGGYGGNTGWSPAIGAKSKVSVSQDGVSWDQIGTVSKHYGAFIQKLYLPKKSAKYLKFQNNNKVGIGYLRVYKDKEKYKRETK